MLGQNRSALFVGLITLLLFAKYAKAALWTPIPSKRGRLSGRFELSVPKLRIENSLSMRLNTSELTFDTETDGSVALDIPFPDGKIIPFKLFPSDVLPEALAAKYPQIKAFSGYPTDGSDNMLAEVDYTPEKGFHAYIVGKDQDIYIDPFNVQNNEYKVFTRDEYNAAAKTHPEEDSWSCKNHGSHSDAYGVPMDIVRKLQSGQVIRENDLQTRYTIALSANGEYSSYHGNTIPSILSAMVTAIQRVSGIYKRSVGVSFQLHPRTDELICLSPCTELGIGFGMLDEIVPFIESRNIPDTTYDLAHGFSTSGGGVARLHSVCSAGAGLTGSANPIGDPFWVDYVAHEVGHQFGAYHTFSDCNGNIGDHPVEPGSGTTIMGYAGLCRQHDVQKQSDPMFHSISIEDMLNYVEYLRDVDECGTAFTSKSTLPSGTVEPTCQVPHSTSFHIRIESSTVDPNASYAFDQVSGLSSPNQYFNKNIPGFRSRIPVKRSYRNFPNLFYIINGATDDVLDEVLPRREYEMTFRAIARASYSTAPVYADASTSSGFAGILYSDIIVDFGGTGTVPFKISPFVKNQQWRADSVITLEWSGGIPNGNLRMSVAKHDKRMDWNNFNVGVDVIDWENKIVELDWKHITDFTVGDVTSTNSIEVLLPNIYDEETIVHVMVSSDDSSDCYYFDVIPYIHYKN